MEGEGVKTDGGRCTVTYSDVGACVRTHREAGRRGCPQSTYMVSASVVFVSAFLACALPVEEEDRRVQTVQIERDIRLIGDVVNDAPLDDESKRSLLAAVALAFSVSSWEQFSFNRDVAGLKAARASLHEVSNRFGGVCSDESLLRMDAAAQAVADVPETIDVAGSVKNSCFKGLERKGWIREARVFVASQSRFEFTRAMTVLLRAADARDKKLADVGKALLNDAADVAYSWSRSFGLQPSLMEEFEQIRGVIGDDRLRRSSARVVALQDSVAEWFGGVFRYLVA